ncbi:hypothetical protein RR46_12738 [Papilio xuthus]|uniref:Uncharacterized protein n=1 Tax=Papilio xuthus TaxID=66420 RepID=A0A194PUP7_PAPXU|nr:hypothetical protein RR46_12738 [Papilio xuthus]
MPAAERCCGGLRRLRRPLSPSRVILERLYKRSQSSSRATDSQDTKFVITESMMSEVVPPPLPPIDFE